MINWILGTAILGSAGYIVTKRIIKILRPKKTCSGKCGDCPYHCS